MNKTRIRRTRIISTLTKSRHIYTIPYIYHIYIYISIHTPSPHTLTISQVKWTIFQVQLLHLPGLRFLVAPLALVLVQILWSRCCPSFFAGLFVRWCNSSKNTPITRTYTKNRSKIIILKKQPTNLNWTHLKSLWTHSLRAIALHALALGRIKLNESPNARRSFSIWYFEFLY